MFTITSGYTFCGGGTTWVDRVGTIYETVQNIENAVPEDQAKNWYLTGFSTDYTITNTTTLESINTMELDVYEFMFRKDLTFKDASLSVGRMLQVANGEEVQLPGAVAKPLITSLGWVPTDANQAMRQIVILSKQRYYIASNNSVSFVKRHKFKHPVKYNSKDFEIQQQTDAANTFLAKAGVTRGIICVFRGLPNPSSAGEAVTIAYNAQTRYTMKELDDEASGAALNY